jgi:hypothetical protein
MIRLLTADWLNTRLDEQSTSEAIDYLAFTLDKYRIDPNILSQGVAFDALLRVLGDFPK